MKIIMIRTLTLTFSTKLQNWGFHVLFLKTTAEKWLGGCIPTWSDCILQLSLLFSNVLVDVLVRWTFQSLVLLYKCIFCNGPSYIKDLFEFRQSVYNLRGNGSILCRPKFNLSWKKQSFSYKLVMLWNKLPSSVRLSSSLKDFKSKLRSITF